MSLATREALETFFLPCYNEHCRFSKWFLISPEYGFFSHFVFYRSAILKSTSSISGDVQRKEAKESLSGDDKLWKFHRLLSDCLTVNHCLEIFLLRFRCIKSKDGIWNFAVMKLSKKPIISIEVIFLAFPGILDTKKKDNICEVCRKMMVDKAEKKLKPSQTLLLQYMLYCIQGKPMPRGYNPSLSVRDLPTTVEKKSR